MRLDIPGMEITVAGTSRQGNTYTLDTKMRITNRLRLLLWVVQQRYVIPWYAWPKVLYAVGKTWARWWLRDMWGGGDD